MLLVMVLLLPLLFLLLKNLLFGGKKLPPGPNLWQVLANISEFRKRPHIAFTNLSKIYGPIMSLRLGTQTVIIASSSAAAKEILHTQDRNFSGRYLPSLCYDVPGAQQSCIAMSKECDDTWKFLRGISHNFMFSPKSVESKTEQRQAQVMQAVKYLRSKEGQVVKLDDVITTTFTNIISNMLVSRNLVDVRGDGEKVKALLEEIVGMASSLGLSDVFSFMKIIDFHTTRKGIKLYEKIVSFWGDMVQKRRAERDNSGISAPDFLNVLIAETTFADDQICLLFMELFLAGIDSSIITSVWLMVELMRHPQIMHKVRDEITKAFEGDTLINESILSESPYLQACIKETLRFHIPGPLLVPHRAIEACKIGEYVIPKDSMVLVNAWAISMNWDDAATFNPDRFLESNIDYRGAHFEFIPFGAGRRMCPGLNVAVKNAQLLVASLVHYFDWSLPGGVDAIDTNDKFGTVLKKEKPLCLVPKLRK